MDATPPPDRTPLVGAREWLDAPAVVERARTWTWRQVHAASIAFADRLDGAPALFNLCNSRVGFLVACLAALRRGRLLILPPSGGSADLSAVVRAGQRPLVVGDAAAWPEAWCADRYLPCAPDPQAPLPDDAALAWRPAWDETAVRLYTSGSTGRPEPQPKTLRQLARGAVVLGARLSAELEGGLASIRRIVCSVTPQHMFGFECSVMLPLVHGTPVVEGRPLLPADVRDALDGGAAAAWIATPLHLRGVAHAGEPVPMCRLVIASTMPLERAVADDCERLARAPVLEIYGSTETGALALRRTAREAGWRALEGVELQAGGDAAIACGSHFASPVRLLDAIAPDAGGGFTLLGRQADLVKIGGRRASLAGLNLLLHGLPGLDDGVFYLPEAGGRTERLCLIYAGAPLDREAACRWLRERLDPVFLPRTLIRVDRLPRSEGGKLRRAALDRLYADWRLGRPSQRPASPGEPIPTSRALRS